MQISPRVFDRILLALRRSRAWVRLQRHHTTWSDPSVWRGIGALCTPITRAIDTDHIPGQKSNTRRQVLSLHNQHISLVLIVSTQLQYNKLHQKKQLTTCNRPSGQAGPRFGTPNDGVGATFATTATTISTTCPTATTEKGLRG